MGVLDPHRALQHDREDARRCVARRRHHLARGPAGRVDPVEAPDELAYMDRRCETGSSQDSEAETLTGHELRDSSRHLDGKRLYHLVQAPVVALCYEQILSAVEPKPLWIAKAAGHIGARGHVFENAAAGQDDQHVSLSVADHVIDPWEVARQARHPSADQLENGAGVLVGDQVAGALRGRLDGYPGRPAKSTDL